jgi:hypothetical protein
LGGKNKREQGGWGAKTKENIGIGGQYQKIIGGRTQKKPPIQAAFILVFTVLTPL